MRIAIHVVNPIGSTSSICVPMPVVHLDYSQRTLIENELDDVVDAKGLRQQTVRRLEPVCCCERCYACLANPHFGKTYPDAEQDWTAEDVLIADDEDGVAAPGWLSLCRCTSCDCRRCVDVCRKLCQCAGRASSKVLPDDSPPMNKKRMTANLPAEDGQQCLMHAVGRRPLTDLQWDVQTNHGSAMKRLEESYYTTTKGGWSRDTYGRLCDATRSWVQPPPNRTICHIVDDVTLERLTSSSPVLTRCCLASRKHATGRHVTKAKSKGQTTSR